MDKIYKDLFNLQGVSGQEQKIKQYIKPHLEKYADEIIYDNLGGMFAIKKSKNKDAKTVMIAAHMDEVGGMVVGITKEGLIKMTNIGGVLPEVFISQHMIVHTDDKLIPGVISAVAPHGLKANAKKATFEDLLLDIGADSKEHAIELGIKLGQQVVAENVYKETIDGKKVISKAIDDRWGCGMVIELLRDIQNIDLDVNIVAGVTVQEEVGLRGGRVASQMINPDLFLALDVSPANDFKRSEDSISGKLGEGFLVRFLDPSNIMPTKLRNYVLDLAESNNIKHQLYRSRGGTDAAIAQFAGAGTLTTTIGICARYIHSTVSMMHKDDHKAASDFVRTLLKSLNNETFEKLKF